MKTGWSAISAVFVSLVLCMTGSSCSRSQGDGTVSISIPENVQAIIDTSCYQCHSAQGQSAAVRQKLDFDTLDQQDASQAIRKMVGIQETVERGRMPPKRYTDQFPERALSETDKGVLLKWAKETAALLDEKK